MLACCCLGVKSDLRLRAVSYLTCYEWGAVSPSPGILAAVLKRKLIVAKKRYCSLKIAWGVSGERTGHALQQVIIT